MIHDDDRESQSSSESKWGRRGAREIGWRLAADVAARMTM
jgi:hypothetical protein